MMRLLLMLISILLPSSLIASTPVVNVYGWGGEIPKRLLHIFEEETGIHVNFSTYDNNETLYAKLHASKRPMYDVIVPSAYFVERLQDQGFLASLDHTRLPNIKNLDPTFTNDAYDPGNQYSVPIAWGATGIFYNQQWVKSPPKTWRNLWNTRWKNQLMLLDDPREVFAIALLSLGYSPNDPNPKHIQEAFNHLRALTPNIKLFASESIQALMIDEDALVGIAWNGDAYKAHAENSNLRFAYPEDGFVIWIDCLALLKQAPHPDEAYAFINFMLKAQSAAMLGQSEGYAIPNQAGKALLPEALQHNPMVYPSPEVLKHGVIQRDVTEANLALYNTYWQQLKFAF
jgi:spermidine/putrescine transport system substrate-binding protein